MLRLITTKETRFNRINLTTDKVVLRSFTYTPVIGASGRDCSFLHAGTNTVMSLCPRSRNQSTANWMPRHEKTSLFPWLQNIPDPKLLIHIRKDTCVDIQVIIKPVLPYTGCFKSQGCWFVSYFTAQYD